MWLTTVVILGFLLYILYRSIKGSERSNFCESPDVISILNKRLARGEITEEEYDRLKGRMSL